MGLADGRMVITGPSGCTEIDAGDPLDFGREVVPVSVASGAGKHTCSLNDTQLAHTAAEQLGTAQWCWRRSHTPWPCLVMLLTAQSPPCCMQLAIDMGQRAPQHADLLYRLRNSKLARSLAGAATHLQLANLLTCVLCFVLHVFSP
jgi:hypothetical protein